MGVKLLFPHAFTLGLGPGKAAAIRAGDVIADVPDALAPLLRRRFGASNTISPNAEPVALASRLLPDAQAAKLSHPLVQKKLKPTQTELLAAAIKELAGAQAKA